MLRRQGLNSGGDGFLLVYVNDILIWATSESDIECTVDVSKGLYDVRH